VAGDDNIAARGRIPEEWALKRCVLLLSCMVGLLLPAAAGADSLVLDWSALLPGLTDTYAPNSSNICTSGHIECIDSVINEMQRRFAPLVQSCDHNALFALLYLRVTQTYRQEVGANPSFFQDNAFVNHEDPVFAERYFAAFDNYGRGNLAQVPQAWQIALNAARDHAVSGTGDLLLGVNAHVQRDLPFVLYAIGLVKPDGTSRKPDHDKVNQILYDAYGPALQEAAARFDPSVNMQLPASLPLVAGLSNQTFFNVVVAWRETAWRNAERLASAPDAGTRAAVASDIENYAASQAQLIRDSTAYGPGQNSGSRDAYCAANHG
jgi:hypothetical protein